MNLQIIHNKKKSLNPYDHKKLILIKLYLFSENLKKKFISLKKYIKDYVLNTQ